MFPTFTAHAKQVLSLAPEEARGLKHDFVGTEHLLLGLVCEENGIAASVLAHLGIKAVAVRRAVEQITGPRDQTVVLSHIWLTPRSRLVISLAQDESRRLGHSYIGTEHLLLGLVHEGEGIAAGILVSQGHQLETARQATLDALVEHNDPS
jgi:ATP-dependent Clp protease ATP-binding subunit ClpC